MTTTDAKNAFEVGDVAVVGRCDERFKKASSLGVLRGDSLAVNDMAPSASYDLPRVGLFKPKNLRDITVWIVERLPKDVRSSFRW